MGKQADLVIEVCVDSVESALGAQAGGADRVELCDNLLEGGTTPSAGMIEIARQRLHIGLQVIIRPRGGDFCFSEIEFEIMQRDIATAKALGADGVVIGLLCPDGTVDAERTRTLIDLARPLNVTFHRAFDMTRDPYEALDTLIQLGVDRILTTGQEASTMEGLDLIADLIRVAGDQVIIMPVGSPARMLAKMLATSGAREIHVIGPRAVDSQMSYRNERVFMGGTLRPPEYTRYVTDPARILEYRHGADE